MKYAAYDTHGLHEGDRILEFGIGRSTIFAYRSPETSSYRIRRPENALSFFLLELKHCVVTPSPDSKGSPRSLGKITTSKPMSRVIVENPTFLAYSMQRSDKGMVTLTGWREKDLQDRRVVYTKETREVIIPMKLWTPLLQIKKPFFRTNAEQPRSRTYCSRFALVLCTLGIEEVSMPSVLGGLCRGQAQSPRNHAYSYHRCGLSVKSSSPSSHRSWALNQ